MTKPEEQEVWIALTTLPAAAAESFARTLVEERLAACVNLVPGVRSFYRWKGAVQADEEVLAVVKTTAGVLERAQARALELHPYEVPEWIAVPAGAGHRPYLDWVREVVDGNPSG